MSKRFLKFSAVLIIVTSFFGIRLYAASAFPISELGNCSSKEECKTFCDDTLHIKACSEYAAKSGLISNREADLAKHFADTIVTGHGPGGCRTKNECVSYCGISNHVRECQIFAVKINSSQSTVGSPHSVSTHTPVVHTQASSTGQIAPSKNPVPINSPKILKPAPQAPVNTQDVPQRPLQGTSGIDSVTPEHFENQQLPPPPPSPTPPEHSQEFQNCKQEIVGSIDGPVSPSDAQAILDCIKSENALPDPNEVGEGIGSALISNVLETTGEFRVFFSDVGKTLTHMFLFR